MARIGQLLLLACLAIVPAAQAAKPVCLPLQDSLLAHLGLAHPRVGLMLSASRMSPTATEGCP